jgi:hypothetical protein
MSLDEQKETAAKQACLYTSSLLQSGTFPIEDVLKLTSFLSVTIEAAKQGQDLAGLKAEVSKMFPSFPAFEPGI